MQGDEEEVDDEEMGVAETYADYMPSKCMYCLCYSHLLIYLIN